MSIYLKNATYIDWETLDFLDTHIKVSRGPGGTIDLTGEIPPGARVLDCTGKLVTRAFACGHHHVYSALARGMPAPPKAPENFHQVLQYIWWRLDRCLDRETIEASALATAVACAKNGVTFVIDHHASPLAVGDSLETIAAAFDRVGVSHLLCYELSDRDGESPRQRGLEATEAYLEAGNPGLVGLHASFTVGDDLLKRAVALAEKYDSGIHIHAAEDPVDQDRCVADYGKRVIERFNDAGVLGFPRSILGHCLHLSDRERRLLGESPAYVVQNVESNLKNNVGFFDGRGLGENIMLGTDGMHSDMLRSAKAAYLVGQRTEKISPQETYRRFRRVHRYLEANRFSGDGDNNLVILDYDSPTEVNRENFLGHFIFGLESRHVESVVSDGDLIVKDRQLLTVDEAETLAFCREMSGKLWRELEKG